MQVHKNVDGETIHDNLKPYRDQTVLYGRLITTHLDYTDDNDLESEIPHINYGPNFNPRFHTYQNFGQKDREFDDFDCSHSVDDDDADFDLRLKVDLNKLEPDFYTTGWGDRTSGPTVFALKLNDKTTREKLGLAANEAYMGLEAVMYGRPGTCDDGNVSPVNGGLSMLPGWADLFSNSVLINGRPMNGLFERSPPIPTCNFAEPCPFLNGVTPDNYLVIPAGIQLGNLSASRRTAMARSMPMAMLGDGPGTYLRVTGALVLDCGHGITGACYDDDPESDPGDISGHSNQEIHPIYSIDVINFPYRPEDINISGRDRS